MSKRTVEYEGIAQAGSDAAGNLRLYRRGRLVKRQAVFHPAGEWSSYHVHENGCAVVHLAREEEGMATVRKLTP